MAGNVYNYKTNAFKYEYQGSLVQITNYYSNFNMQFRKNIVANQIFKGQGSSLISHSELGTLEVFDNIFLNVGFFDKDNVGFNNY